MAFTDDVGCAKGLLDYPKDGCAKGLLDYPKDGCTKRLLDLQYPMILYDPFLISQHIPYVSHNYLVFENIGCSA